MKTVLIALFSVLALPLAASQVVSPSPPRLVPYDGPVYNVFFHPLISDPVQAFSVSSKRVFMDEWFVTVDEFDKVLDSLFERGFVLVSPKLFYVQDSGGKWVRPKVLFPEGKKPLILSEDDVNYYKTMRTHGVVTRLWVDPQNRLAAVIDLPNGDSRVVYHDEVPQVLEDFVAKHPDFSFEGARGVIAETGYDGAFGYHDVGDPLTFDHESQIYEAKRVAEKLRSLGWEFASHSYDHETAWREPEAPFEAAERRWMSEIEPIVGPTPYYVFPFGERWSANRVRMDFLNSLGFRYYFGVDRTSSVEYTDGDIVLGRVAIDGRSLRLGVRALRIYLDSRDVFDPERAKSLSYR